MTATAQLVSRVVLRRSRTVVAQACIHRMVACSCPLNQHDSKPKTKMFVRSCSLSSWSAAGAAAVAARAPGNPPPLPSSPAPTPPKSGPRSMASSSSSGAGAGLVRVAVVGDVHDDWILDEDTKALHFLQPDLVLFTGDYGNENVQLVKSISDIQFPKAAILGNHDCWRTHQFSEKKVDRVRLQLERYGVDDMAGSARKIYDAASSAPEEHSVILLAHNGPTGLGSRMDDICGRDWVAGGGDHGDPDLQQAISDLQRETGVSIPLVVFGHMHKSLAHGGGLRKMIAFGANRTIYLNGAVVPRVKQAGESSPAVISTSGRDGLQGSGSMAPTSRAFTTVDLFDGTVEKISEVWVMVSGAGAELEEETLLYKRPREHM